MMERAVLLCAEPVLDREHLPLDKLEPQPASTTSPGLFGDGKESKDIYGVGAARTERDRIVEALASCAAIRAEPPDCSGSRGGRSCRSWTPIESPGPRKSEGDAREPTTTHAGASAARRPGMRRRRRLPADLGATVAACNAYCDAYLAASCPSSNYASADECRVLSSVRRICRWRPRAACLRSRPTTTANERRRTFAATPGA